MKTLFALSVVSLVCVGSPSAQAQSDDEKQIRELALREAGGFPFTNDRIFWSGPYKRPVVGLDQKGEPIGGDSTLGRVPKSERRKTEIVRVEVSKSGDLAYEFSNVELSFERTDGTRVSAPTSVLRVWRKEAGQWKVAAMFARPHHQE